MNIDKIIEWFIQSHLPSNEISKKIQKFACAVTALIPWALSEDTVELFTMILLLSGTPMLLSYLKGKRWWNIKLIQSINSDLSEYASSPVIISRSESLPILAPVFALVASVDGDVRDVLGEWYIFGVSIFFLYLFCQCYKHSDKR